MDLCQCFVEDEREIFGFEFVKSKDEIGIGGGISQVDDNVSKRNVSFLLVSGLVRVGESAG